MPAKMHHTSLLRVNALRGVRIKGRGPGGPGTNFSQRYPSAPRNVYQTLLNLKPVNPKTPVLYKAQ